jgi:uncharacterized protein
MRWLLRIILGLIVFIALAVGAIWLWKPWVPPIVLAEPGPSGQRVTDDGLFMNYFPGPKEGSHPLILLLGGSEGGLSPAGPRMAAELQKQGFHVLQVAYFRAPGQPTPLVNIPLETFDRAKAWAAKQPGVDASRLGIMGVSKGAEAVLVYAARRPDVRAVVSAQPSSVVWSGLDWEYIFFPPYGSSWSEGGKPLPYVTFGGETGYDYNQGIISGYRGGLKTMDKHPDAHIRIEDIKGAVMLVCGEMDTLWPSCEMSRQLEARAKDKGAPAPLLLAYDKAGHAGFGVPAKDITGLGQLGGTDADNQAAREDAWPKAVEFLKANLAAAAAEPIAP